MYSRGTHGTTLEHPQGGWKEDDFEGGTALPKKGKDQWSGREQIPIRNTNTSSKNRAVRRVNLFREAFPENKSNGRWGRSEEREGKETATSRCLDVLKKKRRSPSQFSEGKKKRIV